MSLGVILHAASIYRPDSAWRVNDARTHIVFEWIVSAIHVFRLPTFFMLSGYLAAMSLRTRTVGDFIRSRSRRTLVPLVVTLLTLNLAELAVTDSRPLAVILSADGLPVFHLWFLVDLCIFFLSVRVWQWLTELPAVASRVEYLLARPMMAIALLGIGFHIFQDLALLMPDSRHEYWGITSLYRLAYYLPYFILGMSLWGLLQRNGVVLRYPVGWLVAGLALAVVPKGLVTALAGTADAVRFLNGIASLACGLALFTWCISVRRPASPLAAPLADASYSVYLFHHSAVVLVGTLLLGVDLPPWMKFGIVTIAACSWSMLLHRVVMERTVVGRLVFGRAA